MLDQNKQVGAGCCAARSMIGQYIERRMRNNHWRESWMHTSSSKLQAITLRGNAVEQILAPPSQAR